jgi:hypothetical protein
VNADAALDAAALARRPRMRATDGSGELPVASYELFSQTEVLGRMAMERMLAGPSTRRYPVGLEPVGARVEQAPTSGDLLGGPSATASRAISARLLLCPVRRSWCGLAAGS